MSALVPGGVLEEEVSFLSRLCGSVVCGDKGVLATDESPQGTSFLFSMIGIANEEENRRLYRQFVYWTPDLELCFSTAFITEEAFFQSDDEAEGFSDLLLKKGMFVGIRVDRGPGIGLDGLADRLESLKDRGASILRWRGVFKVGGNKMTKTAGDLARFAAISQAHGLLPVVSVDILPDGDHSLQIANRHLSLALAAVVKALHDLNVSLEGVILSVPFLQAGQALGHAPEPADSAAATMDALSAVVPPTLGGILFTSAGLSEENATCTLNLVSKLKGAQAPWRIGFAFGRAQQVSTVMTWEGKLANVSIAQEQLLHRGKANCAALAAQYEPGSVGGPAYRHHLFIKQYYF